MVWLLLGALHVEPLHCWMERRGAAALPRPPGMVVGPAWPAQDHRPTPATWPGASSGSMPPNNGACLWLLLLPLKAGSWAIGQQPAVCPSQPRSHAWHVRCVTRLCAVPPGKCALILASLAVHCIVVCLHGSLPTCRCACCMAPSCSAASAACHGPLQLWQPLPVMHAAVLVVCNSSMHVPHTLRAYSVRVFASWHCKSVF